jgi:hypothetical protein
VWCYVSRDGHGGGGLGGSLPFYFRQNVCHQVCPADWDPMNFSSLCVQIRRLPSTLPSLACHLELTDIRHCSLIPDLSFRRHFYADSLLFLRCAIDGCPDVCMSVCIHLTNCIVTKLQRLQTSPLAQIYLVTIEVDLTSDVEKFG